LTSGVYQRSEEHRRRISLRQIGKGNPMYGKKQSDETKEKIGLALSNDKHPKWKGDQVTYNPLHRWIKRHFPKSELCQICNVKPSLDLANMSGIYNRDFSNWQYLCRKCHNRYDRSRHIWHYKNKKEG
jgi:hypothetical protein